MTTIRCHFCARLGTWVNPATGVQLCGGCMAAVAARRWSELARLWLSTYPNEWVEDVAAFIEGGLGVADVEVFERSVDLVTCDGCDGRLCGKPHVHRRVLVVSTVVATNPKDAG